MSSRITFAQVELIAAANARKLWRHSDGHDYTAGTHGHRQVDRRVATAHRRGLLVRGQDQAGGWLWEPTATGRQEALDHLATLADMVRWLRADLGFDPDEEDHR